MITAADEISIDFRTSCSKDEAVAKLLGWMQGSVHRKYIHLTDAGISADQLPYLHTLDGSLADHLLELRQAAHLELSSAFDAGAAPEILDEKESVVTHWDDEIKKAAKYLRAIDDELSKGIESALSLDQEASREAGTPQILLNSLDRWAQTKYKNLVFSTDADEPANGKPMAQSEQDEPLAPLSESRSPKDENLLASFAFLVELYSATLPKLHHDDGTPKVDVVAKCIAQHAIKMNNKMKLRGQSDEAIKDRIEEAMKVKRSKLPSVSA